MSSLDGGMTIIQVEQETFTNYVYQYWCLILHEAACIYISLQMFELSDYVKNITHCHSEPFTVDPCLDVL